MFIHIFNIFHSCKLHKMVTRFCILGMASFCYKHGQYVKCWPSKYILNKWAATLFPVIAFCPFSYWILMEYIPLFQIPKFIHLLFPPFSFFFPIFYIYLFFAFLKIKKKWIYLVKKMIKLLVTNHFLRFVVHKTLF